MTKQDFILDWETMKKELPEWAELFSILESEAMAQLVDSRQLLPGYAILESGLATVQTVSDLRLDRKKFMDLLWYFSGASVYNFNAEAVNNEFCFSVHMDNVGLFWAVSLIYLDAVLWHATGGFPMKLRIYFENDISRDYIDKMVRECVVPLFSEITGYEGLVSAEEDGA